MRRATVLVLAVWALVSPVLAATAAEELAAIQNVEVDPQQCYRVRDVFLEREDIKFYFIDGYLLFARPLDGRTLGALFVAVEPADEGEILLIPPNVQERQSLVRFTGEPVLNQKFRTAMMFFTDDTGDALRSAIEESETSRLDAATGEDLARKWSNPVRNVIEGLSLRMLFDVFGDLPAKDGFFAAALAGGPEGRFDVVIDPRIREQVTLGQSVWREGRRFHEVWAQFPGRTFRSGAREGVYPRDRLDNYHIETHLGSDLSMRVVASADFLPEGSRERLFAFNLSQRLRLEKVLVEGAETEFLQFERDATNGPGRSNDLIAIVLPEDARGAEKVRIAFHYEGTVVNDAGNGVYYVGSRGSWYPRRENRFAAFKLIFHHPEELDLVATGKAVETSTSDGVRTSVFETESPIRLAGFNLGAYERVHHDVGEYRIEVCANRKVEESLEPKSRLPMIWSPPTPSLGRRRRGSAPATIIAAPQPESAPSPVTRLDYVAADSAEAFSFFLETLGPPASSKIVISPIPGGIGQGFPGLVYASTLSYFRPSDAPLADKTAEEKLFYADLLRTHEISHQWWGNVVAPEDGADEWLMESLATYSSLLLLEKRRDREAMDRVLEGYKRDLLTRGDNGEPIEKAGAIVLSERLRTADSPDAMRIIVYEKGAWIIHMLRGVMGDESFFAFLKELCARFRFEVINTEDFRELAAEFLSEESPDPELRDFFDQWVYGTGIPTLKVAYDVTNAGGKFLVSGRVLQSGVADGTRIQVSLQANSVAGPQGIHVVATNGNVTEFEMTVPQIPTQIRLDPQRFILMNP